MRAKVLDIYRMHPTESERRLRLLADAIRTDEELLMDVALYVQANTERSLLAQLSRPDPPPPEVLAQRRAETEQAARRLADEVIQAQAQKARVFLLEMMTPLGKRLRDCTKEECLELSRTTSRFFAGLARELDPGQKVGHALSEDRVHEIYEQART